MRTAIYAGTFDPITFGHWDVAERAANCFDNVILAVGHNSEKKTMFSVEERVAMAEEVCADLENVEVKSFEGLLVNYAKEQNAAMLVRGLRAFSDFEYEFQIALTNRKLAPEIETLFLMPREQYSYVSSSRVREVASLGGDVSSFAPECVIEALNKKLSKMKGS